MLPRGSVARASELASDDEPAAGACLNDSTHWTPDRVRPRPPDARTGGSQPVARSYGKHSGITPSNQSRRGVSAAQRMTNPLRGVCLACPEFHPHWPVVGDVVLGESLVVLGASGLEKIGEEHLVVVKHSHVSCEGLLDVAGEER